MYFLSGLRYVQIAEFSIKKKKKKEKKSAEDQAYVSLG